MPQRDIVHLGRRPLLAGLLGGAGALLVGTEAHAADIVEALLGAYKHADPEKERRAVAAAIEDVVSQMSSLVRGAARERLKAANPIPASLSVAADKHSFMLAYDGELFAAPLDGKSVKVKSKAGEEMALRLTVAKSAVEQLFWSEDKSRRNSFAISDGKLVVAVTVEATLLPKPLQYKLTYVRACVTRRQRNLAEIASAQRQGSEALNGLLAAITVVSLLVGGITGYRSPLPPDRASWARSRTRPCSPRLL